MGVNLGLIHDLEIPTVNKLFIYTQPAHLQKITGGELDTADRNIERARYLRHLLNKEEPQRRRRKPELGRPSRGTMPSGFAISSATCWFCRGRNGIALMPLHTIRPLRELGADSCLSIFSVRYLNCRFDPLLCSRVSYADLAGY